MNVKALIRSSPIILQKSVLRCCKAKFDFLLFLSQIFMIHRKAGEVDISRIIVAEAHLCGKLAGEL